MSKQHSTNGDTLTHFGNKHVPLSQKQPLVDKIFDKSAKRYDIMNDVISAGIHRVWKDAMVAKLSPPRRAHREYKLLDMAGGTADIALRAHQASHGFIHVTVADINPHMLKQGQARVNKAMLADKISFVQEDAQNLKFEDNTFDAYTIAFGMRNVPQWNKALNQAYRVLRPGGKFLCLEFCDVDMPGLDALYRAYSDFVIPQLAEWIMGDKEPYKYLVESIKNFPKPDRFKAMMQEAGFKNSIYEIYSGGIVALHFGMKF